ncbi:Cobalt-precorrin-5B (C1)-methyltransferase [Saccharolobus shibatae B12]|uniref:Cobalt-precorrin-5B C(1)-methyltransferase n=1 Tax=Saccharolobus shibatae (strain ATCC 51178 / DSM 5389 / JCM 8931 / NBRC 15437 / B12) TaxID=523848 RepID=A0A8F5BMV6_SACSH|nr:cobalt-precorrin-5B (C(1))-methyltransferase CbiD [Saccharolobus shibatae]QXJ28237.1 Cobalt-precorrin-5B (C1)-methyltransferase [Saccharolobus shibatae B12]
MIINSLKRFGITTGAAASAAAKAAVIGLLNREKRNTVVIPTPIGLRLEIPVEKVEIDSGIACAEVKKFSGDNPDILDGLVIRCCAKLNESNEIVIVGGKGVGKVTRSGLKATMGETAISPTVRDMVINAIREVTDKGIQITIEVPNGEIIAENTLNKMVGIVGGISILGTTGIETPVSDDDYLEHIKCELNVIRQSYDFVVIAPGNSAAKYASELFDSNSIIKVGDRIGDSIKLASSVFRKVILAGLPAKLLKVYAGIFNTHYSQGDARLESLTHASVLAGLPYDVLAKISNALSVEEAFTYMTKEQRRKVMNIVAEKILSRIKGFNGDINFCVIIFDYDGESLSRVGC